ncbi:MAG: hypothetical protein MZV49_08975 [Rhodopseudomonas palustris]|nr:hypothetical protein [Rhodopseudomonas palustris]
MTTAARRLRRSQSVRENRREARGSPESACSPSGRSTFDVEFAGNGVRPGVAGAAGASTPCSSASRAIHYEADAALARFRRARRPRTSTCLLVVPGHVHRCRRRDRDRRDARRAARACGRSPRSAPAGGCASTRSAASNLASHTLSRRGKSLENVHGAPDSAAALAADRGGRAGRRRSCATSKRAKILVVGEHPDRLRCLQLPAPTSSRERFGVETVTTPVERVPRRRQGAARCRRRRAVRAPRARLREPGRDGPGSHAQDAEGVCGAQVPRRHRGLRRAWPCAAGPSSSPSTAAPRAARSRS